MPAGELYTGSLFRACKRYAQSSGHRWAILSAEHGLVLPDEELAPYDRMLRLKGVELLEWSERAAQRYVREFGKESCECLAGQLYSRPFTNQLYVRSVRCSEPLEGLELGQRLSWCKARYEKSAA